MTLGAEPKKIAILGGLVIVILGVLYSNYTGDSSPAPAPRAAANPAAASSPTGAPEVSQTGQARPRVQGRVSSEFRPRVAGSRPDDKVDPATIDPELRLDLLAKIQAVAPIEGGRNLFQFGAAPPPPDKPMAAVPKNVPKIPVTPPPPPPPAVTINQPPPKPVAPPINLKYYGYVISKTTGRKQACLLDGEDIIVATENQTVKQRYKIVSIALNSIVIEDTQAKSTQTLKLEDIPS